MFMLKEGGMPLLTTMPVDDNDPQSPSWHGVGGDCAQQIPLHALDFIDDVCYLTVNELNDFDDVGRYRMIEPGSQPDWRRREEHFRGWIPIAPELGMEAEWWQDLATPTPLRQTSEGRWEIEEDHLDLMMNSLSSFRNALESLAESSKYDVHTDCPLLFDVDSLHESFATVRELQITATHAKRSVLEMWGHMACWTATVSDWGKGLTDDAVNTILGWNLQGRRKRGFLISLPRDWQDIDFGSLIAQSVPLYYVWGIFESADKRFSRLNPALMSGYRDACAQKGVRSLWGDEISWLSKEFAESARFDAFLQCRRNPKSIPAFSAPEQGVDEGLITYCVQDFDSWARRGLAEDENWRTLDKLYHHVITEKRAEQETIVVFHRFHKKPKQIILAGDDFMDEELVETNPSEIRERFKGKCAPKLGQVFDPNTGIERSKPLDPEDGDAIRRWEQDTFLTPPPDGLGRHELKGIGADGSANPDTTKMRRSIGPRNSGPSSDHSSERHQEDSHRRMGYEGGWAEAMARPDHAGNYQRYRPSRRQNHPQRRGPSQASQFWDARSNVSSSSRRSASPDNRQPFAGRQRSITRTAGQVALEAVQVKLARRADFLDDLTEWASQVTHNVVLWRIPMQFSWNFAFLKEGYLIVSATAEVRLRLLAVMNPSFRFLRHVLETAIERGIPFNIALPSSTCQSFRPRGPIAHRATTKAQLESTDRRLEIGISAMHTHTRWLKLLGDIAALDNARAIIGRGGVASWIVRAHGYVGLVDAFMNGPSTHVTVYHGGGNDSADEDSKGLRWDELSENDYQCLYGYVAGQIRERDTWMYPPDEMLEDLSKHYHREWNPVVDDLFRRIKAEWEDHPCRGKMRNRKEWKEFFHASNHGKYSPAIEVNASWIDEGKDRLSRAFEGSWSKRRVWEISLPEQFKEGF
ncbi:hypothetical protein C8R47DRAFT_1214732 [Mycena vitilis]|nr:hypothetical protein C8R47DRAFT_1214732 [Mycena vitilis]